MISDQPIPARLTRSANVSRRLSTLVLLLVVLGRDARAEPHPWTLDECYRHARARSERVRRAEQDLVQATFVKRAARAATLPQVALEDDYYRQNTVRLGSPTDSTGNAFTASRNQALVTLHQPLFSGFRDRHFLRYAASNIAAREASVEASARDLYAAVARAFYGVLVAQAQLEALDSVVKVERERRREIEARHEVGLARRTEVLLVESQLAEDEARLTRARNDLALAREQLGYELGVPAPAQLDDTVAMPGELAPPADPGEAAGLRADYAALEHAVEAARYQVKVARGSYLPEVALDADLFLDRHNYSLFNQKTRWAASLVFTLPVFDGGKIAADVGTASSLLEQATLDRDELARRIGLELASLRLALDSDLAQWRTLSSSVESSEESLRLVQEEYREGLATNLEVMAAQNLLLSNRLTYEQQRYQVKLDVVSLGLARGQLPEAPDSAPARDERPQAKP